MKKIIAVLLLAVLMSSVTFAESLDDTYINLIFDKFESYNDEIKKERSELLDILMGSNVGLEILYNQLVDTKKEAMIESGISEAVLRKNIDILKTWSIVDRKALISAGVSGDKAALVELNNKNSVGESSPIIVVSPATSTEVTKADRIQKLSAKGLIVGEIQEIPDLMNKRFLDTETHWSNDYVLFLVSRGIISGYDDTHYKPENDISKAEIVTLITKLIVSNEDKLEQYEGNIPDIEKGNWYDVYMKRAYTLGYIHTNISGLLEPNHKSTREEVIEILINAIKILDIPIEDEMKIYKGGYKDFDQITESRQEAMTVAINLGFIKGVDEETLNPLSEIKRGEVAVVIKKLYMFIVDNI